MKVPAIHTIDAREHGFLEGMSKHYKWNPAQVYTQINLSVAGTIESLRKKKVVYADLKNALIPHSDRKEIAFVFDSRQVPSSWYGYEIAKVFVPLLDEKSINSILLGDYIGDYRHAEMYRTLFFQNIHQHKDINYKIHELFYIIYLNNLSDEHFNRLHSGLKEMNAYVGYFDLTYSSPLKSILSTILVRAILKYKSTIINPTEADIDENLTGFPFEENGYRVIGIDDLTYGIFLSYKIERAVFPRYEADHQFSLNALSEEVRDTSDLKLVIEEAKLGYLRKVKSGSMELAGLTKITIEDLSKLIRNKLKNNYLFNLTFNPEHEVMKFNILIEVPRSDRDKPMKLTVALEYAPRLETLRLITMF